MGKKVHVYKHHNKDGTTTTRKTVTKNGVTESWTTRKTEKKKHRLRWVILIILLLAIFGNRSSNNSSTKKTVTSIPTTAVTIEKATQKSKEESSFDDEIMFIPAAQKADETGGINNNTKSEITETIYAENDLINLYFNRFNSIAPEKKITSADVARQDTDKKAHLSKNGFDVTIEEEDSLLFIIAGNTAKTINDYKETFITFAKPFVPDLSDQEIGTIWAEVSRNMSQQKKFKGFVSQLNGTEDKIENLVIEGTIN